MPEPTKAYPGGELNPRPTKMKPTVDEKLDDFKKRKSEAGQDLSDVLSSSASYDPYRMIHATDF